MSLILFSKFLKDSDTTDLIRIAKEYKLDGYDLCVRPGYVVNPDNACVMLPKVVGDMKEHGLCVPMVTGNFDLLYPTHPTAEPILAAMDTADVRLLKLGYFALDPEADYRQQVDNMRKALESWEVLARQYGVKICYHTHSNRNMGLNCAALLHLLQDFDPALIGAYIDPAHLLIEGEEFAVGLSMVMEYLSIVALKDVMLEREEVNGHGKTKVRWVCAGKGMVDWTSVFGTIAKAGFTGPMSIHCEFESAPECFCDCLRNEAAFFRKYIK